MITSFDHYECVGCSYIYPPALVHNARYDYPCPRCGRKMSDSVFVKAREEEVDKDWVIND